jgi:hypothetical protein
MTDRFVKIPYGLHVPTGRMIHIASARNGDDCECVCAECGWALRARQGPVNEAHFAHQPDGHGGGGGGGPCVTAPETSLHKAAKQFLLDAGELVIPALAARHPSGAFGRVVQGARRVALIEPRKEVQGLPGFVPDVMGMADGAPLIIEIHVTHRVDAKKQALIRKHGVSAMEIYLDSYRAMPENTHREIVLSTARRVWLWHTRQAEIDAVLAREVAEAEAARQRAAEARARLAAEAEAQRLADVAAAEARRQAAWQRQLAEADERYRAELEMSERQRIERETAEKLAAERRRVEREEADKLAAEAAEQRRIALVAEEERQRVELAAERERRRRQWEAEEPLRRARAEEAAERDRLQRLQREEEQRQERVRQEEEGLRHANAILAWAESYYPARANPPPDLSGLGPAYVVWLFQQATSRKAHLALVDQEPIRRWFGDPRCSSAAKAAWERHAP